MVNIVQDNSFSYHALGVIAQRAQRKVVDHLLEMVYVQVLADPSGQSRKPLDYCTSTKRNEVQTCVAYINYMQPNLLLITMGYIQYIYMLIPTYSVGKEVQILQQTEEEEFSAHLSHPVAMATMPPCYHGYHASHHVAMAIVILILSLHIIILIFPWSEIESTTFLILPLSES